MDIKFLKDNGTFLFGWMALLSIIMTFEILDSKDEGIGLHTSISVISVQENALEDEVKPRFFPLMFFYSK